MLYSIRLALHVPGLSALVTLSNVQEVFHLFQPLFLYLPFQAVHMPVQAPESCFERYGNIKDETLKVYAG